VITSYNSQVLCLLAVRSTLNARELSKRLIPNDFFIFAVLEGILVHATTVRKTTDSYETEKLFTVSVIFCWSRVDFLALGSASEED